MLIKRNLVIGLPPVHELSTWDHG